ncbi:MAG TPA: DEAD/DEAH box helicase [bacterium]|nr:DEAD/DEAH box helicase [bacterium]
MKPRDYQTAAVDALFDWWGKHQGNPILSLPTGAGKSIVAAEITRRLFEQWPEHHPRTVVIVPSKELAEQNAAKLIALLPPRISVGYYSASLGQKRHDADVIVATIGSIAKAALKLGNIRCVIIDECHLVSNKGSDVGRYRQFMSSLARVCQFRTVGMTATPFRGNGEWLTAGDDALFTGVAHSVKVQSMLDLGYLSPLVPPPSIRTCIDTSQVRITGGDYNLGDLQKAVKAHYSAIANEAVQLASERKKWIAFTVSVDGAHMLAGELEALGVIARVVTGDTEKAERERLIAEFRSGSIRCLVTVLALATGFDVPDVDCVIWCRPTKSPVLYVQGAGRGLRPAPGKTDCLWLDFTDTTERLGAVDLVTGKYKKKGDAPYAICPECGDRVTPASAPLCSSCGARMRDEKEAEAPEPPKASDAPVMAAQIKPKRHEITRVTYAEHIKDGSRPTLRVEYWAGMLIVAREWVCLEHAGFAGNKAKRWWGQRASRTYLPTTVNQAMEWINGGYQLQQPKAIHVAINGKYPEIIDYEWNK